MKTTFFDIPGLAEIHPVKHKDERGYFLETFRRNWFEENVTNASFVQSNQALSAIPGTIRGLHAQTAPFEQGKLVQCLFGSIFDVAVDARPGSPTFGKWAAVSLSEEQCNQFWIPPGFLHGYCSLTPNAVISYQVTGYYSRESEIGVRWNDPEIGIEWPEIANENTLSAKDRDLPMLSSLSNISRSLIKEPVL